MNTTARQSEVDAVISALAAASEDYTTQTTNQGENKMVNGEIEHAQERQAVFADTALMHRRILETLIELGQDSVQAEKEYERATYLANANQGAADDWANKLVELHQESAKRLA